MTVTEAIEGLSAADRARLTWNFEQGRADYVAVPREVGLFIGVHLVQVCVLEVLEEAGAWALARKRGKSDHRNSGE